VASVEYALSPSGPWAAGGRGDRVGNTAVAKSVAVKVGGRAPVTKSEAAAARREVRALEAPWDRPPARVLRWRKRRRVAVGVVSVADGFSAFFLDKGSLVGDMPYP